MAQKQNCELKVFRWRGISRNGKRCQGHEYAATSSHVRVKLTQQNIRVTHLRVEKVSPLQRYNQRIKPYELPIFTRQLATMLTANIPLLQAIKLIRDNQRHVSFKSILHNIAADIEMGIPIADAFRTHAIFPPSYIDLITCGETSGKLTEVFQQLAKHQEKAFKLRKQIIKASIYPSLVVIVSLSVIYLMLTMVVPQFKSMFASFGAELPWFTQQVLSISNAIQAHAVTIFTLLIFIFLVLRVLRASSPQFALCISHVVRRLPVVGKVMSKSFVAQFSRTLATSVSAGLPLLTCLNTAKQNQYPPCYQVALAELYTNTSSGMPLYLAMKRSNLFCEMTLQMVMIGEESGCLDDMLNRIASLHENEIDDLVEQLGQLIEPLVIVVLSLIVGSIVLAIYLPIFNLMNVMG